jgi:hypothetical protein
LRKKEVEFIANEWKSVLPEGWEDCSMITLIGETGTSNFASNIVVSRQRVNGKTSVEGYAQLQKEAMMREIPNVQVLDERPATINGVPAFQRLQRFEAEPHFIQQVQTFILTKQTIFVITGTAAIADFDRSIAAFRNFTENFRFSANT